VIKERFKTEFAKNIFRNKYAQGPNDTWDALAERLVDDVCGTRGGTREALMSPGDREQLTDYIKTMRFIPGGRYLYYAGRPYKAYNNCYLLRAEEDTREEWSNVTWRAMSCLMTGGGIGIDYSKLRPAGKVLSRTGGTASGPIPLMFAINEIGRNVMQGGSRRSAIYASLNWQHEDIPEFLTSKNWSPFIKEQKEKDFNFPAPLDMTNISVNYDDAALVGGLENNPVFLQNVRQAMETGEPGFSFNFGDKENETLRNACTEVTSEDDSDV
jgi:ribonucleoside-diphosphate reductase alpha chain